MRTAACPPRDLSTTKADRPALSAIKANLTATGHAMAPALFDSVTMASLREEMDAARFREEGLHGRDRLEVLGQTGYVTDVLAMGPTMRAILGSPQIALLVEALLGIDARLCVAQGIILDPGKGRGTWPRQWHADFYPGAEAVCDPAFPVTVNCLLAVDDMTLENGATGIVPGSHRLLGSSAELTEALENLEQRAPVSAGSVMLLDGGLWHCAGFNASTQPRRIIKMLFGRAWVRPKLDYAALWRANRWDDAPSDLPRLLGFGLTRA